MANIVPNNAKLNSYVIIRLITSYRTKLYSIIVFSGLSSQGFGRGRSREFGFGAALKRKIYSHKHYVSADADFSERVHPEV